MAPAFVVHADPGIAGPLAAAAAGRAGAAAAGGVCADAGTAKRAAATAVAARRVIVMGDVLEPGVGGEAELSVLS
jgi:hypothetical protein